MQKTISITYNEQEFQTLLIDCVNSCLKHMPNDTGNQREVDQILTIKQAAELLNLSVPTLYGYVHRAEIPVSKRGNRLYFSKQELLDWIKSGRKKTVSEISGEANGYLKGKKKRGEQ